MPLAAVRVNAYVPPLPAGGVPVSVAVPSTLSVSVNQAGNWVPVRDSVALGTPLVVMVNEPAWPTTKLVLSALVNAGAVPAVSVAAVVVAGEPTPLLNTARYRLPLSV